MQDKGKGETIGTLFSRKQYKIPIYQRRYVWNEEYWGTLWKDIKKKFTQRRKGEPSSHFTGVIITRIYKDKKIDIPKIDILDGQQRLTTFQIILCAIRDICRELKYDYIATETQKLLVNHGDDAKYKFYPKEGFDKEAFCALIDSTCRRKHIIDDAYTYFEIAIKKLVAEDHEKIHEKINTLYKTIIYDFRMIPIDVNEWGDPEKLFTIFHVPGKILDEFDWLRNDLFLRAEEDSEDLYNRYWKHFDTEDYWNDTEKQELFFQTFLMAKLGPDDLKKETKLFSLYQKKVAIDGRNIKEEFKDIKNYARTYEELDVDSEFKARMQFYKDLSTYREEDSDNLYFISQYKNNITVIRSFIMHLQHELKEPLDKNEILRVFEILESYVMRRLLEDTVTGTSAYQAIKSFFRDLFKSQSKGTFSVVNMVEYLVRTRKRRWVSNTAVSNWFENNGYHKRENSAAKILAFTQRYILYRIENLEREKFKKEPLSFEKEKKEFPPSRIPVKKYDKLNDEDASNSLGNLTFCWGHEASPGSSDFDNVKNFLQKHGNDTLILNQEICKEDNWGTIEISKREDKLLLAFYELWKSEDSFLNNTVYWKALEDKYEVGHVVTGKVRNISEFGVTVELEEGVEGVIRPQEIAWARSRNIDPSDYVNEDDIIKVRILEISEKKQTLSLSKKQAQPDPWEEVPEKYKVGSVVRGKIFNIVDYGAFVELEEGIIGLIHISELADRRVERPEEILSIGEELALKVIRLDTEERKISLSLRAAMHDPWVKAPETYKVGTVVQGKIVRLTNVGAFVELEEGIIGLIHISELADRRVERPEEILSIGEELALKVIRLDTEERKISLSLRAVMHDPWVKVPETYKVGTVVQGKIASLTDFGAFVDLEEGISGLIPNSQLSNRWVDNPAEIVSVGEELELKVIQVNPEERQIRLSLKALVKESRRKPLPRNRGDKKKPLPRNRGNKKKPANLLETRLKDVMKTKNTNKPKG